MGGRLSLMERCRETPIDDDDAAEDFCLLCCSIFCWKRDALQVLESERASRLEFLCIFNEMPPARRLSYDAYQKASHGVFQSCPQTVDVSIKSLSNIFT